jgi:hypothetical protein
MTHQTKETLKFGAILIGLAVLGGILVRVHVPNLDNHFTEAVGHALIVAAILGLTVDFFVKTRMVREISQDTFKYLVGHRLPDEIKDKIQEVVETKIVRSNWRFNYHIQPNGDGRIRLVTDLEYSVENISNRPLEYEQAIFLGKYTEPKFIELRCDSSEGEPCYCLNEEYLSEQLETRQYSGKEWTAEVVGNKMMLKPKKKYPNVKYVFGAKYQQMFPENGGDIFEFGSLDIPTTTIGVTITASYPNEFEFRASTKEANKDRWEFGKVFLPGEFVGFWWRKRENSRPPAQSGDINGDSNIITANRAVDAKT